MARVFTTCLGTAVLLACTASCQDAAGVNTNPVVPARGGAVRTAGAPASVGPELISLASLSQNFQPVHFPHGAHARRNASCANCHHHPTSFSETPACRECHGQPFQDQARPGLKGAFHRQCIGCHQTGGRGPLHCDGCHRRK